MNRTLEEWIEIYNKKSLTKFERDKRFRLMYYPDKGFCEMTATDKIIVIAQVSGDGKFWKKIAERIARQMNYKLCATTCSRREIFAYIRLFGHKIKIIDENKNLKGYYTQDKFGNWALLAECIFKNGSHGYKILWQVPKAVKE